MSLEAELLRKCLSQGGALMDKDLRVEVQKWLDRNNPEEVVMIGANDGYTEKGETVNMLGPNSGKPDDGDEVNDNSDNPEIPDMGVPLLAKPMLREQRPYAALKSAEKALAWLDDHELRLRSLAREVGQLEERIGELTRGLNRLTCEFRRKWDL